MPTNFLGIVARFAVIHIGITAIVWHKSALLIVVVATVLALGLFFPHLWWYGILPFPSIRVSIIMTVCHAYYSIISLYLPYGIRHPRP